MTQLWECQGPSLAMTADWSPGSLQAAVLFPFLLTPCFLPNKYTLFSGYGPCPTAHKPRGMFCCCRFGALPLLISLALHPYRACCGDAAVFGAQLWQAAGEDCARPASCFGSTAFMDCALGHQLPLPCCASDCVKGKQAVQKADPAVLPASFGMYVLTGALIVDSLRALTCYWNQQQSLDSHV